METLLYITWDIDPQAFSLLGREIRWYGILWALGVLGTAFVVQKMYKYEKLPEEWFDSLFMNVLVCLLIGARLGHCLFYEPMEYLSNPISLIQVWKGGLASHGGAIGMVIGVCLYSMKVTKTKLNWRNIFIGGLAGFILAGGIKYIISPDTIDATLGIAFLGLFVGVAIAMLLSIYPTAIQTLDRLVVGVALGATSIRLGNLMNHEIYGGPLDKPWAFKFILNIDGWKKGAEPIYSLPSHPTQIYEALTYFCIFLIGMFLYYKTKARFKTGLILGISLIGIFLSRFLVEFIKNVQVDYESDMILNMGQLLSLPFVIWGFYLVWSALKNNNKERITNKTK